MTTREVPREEWPHFFEDLGRRRRDAPATVRVLDPSLGAQVEGESLPFAGIDLDRKGGGSIEILLGARPGKNLEHDVASPVRVSVEAAQDGSERAVEIEGADGARVLLEFER
jgi:hypothetical protein